MTEVFKIVKQKYERCKMLLNLMLRFVIMHYSVRCGHRGLRPMPVVARLCYVMTLLLFRN